jgi:hypothetical protein
LKSFVGQVSIPADCCGGYGKPPYKLLGPKCDIVKVETNWLTTLVSVTRQRPWSSQEIPQRYLGIREPEGKTEVEQSLGKGPLAVEQNGAHLTGE